MGRRAGSRVRRDRPLPLGLPHLALLLSGWVPLSGQEPLPLEPLRPSGLAVSPVYEGWYPNTDGTLSLSFGYMNRNSEEVLEVPVGAANSLDGPLPEQGLPTRFLPRRHYGVFTVVVPPGFAADDQVLWTLDVRGRRFAIPGRLNPLYQIDALGAPATGDRPPGLRLEPGSEEVHGPHGVVAGPLQGRAGQPLELSTWAMRADGDSVTVHWYDWSGPAPVRFSPSEVTADPATGQATTSALFVEPGDYVVYLRTNESNDGQTGHEQCCWTNGYLKVTVTPSTGREDP